MKGGDDTIDVWNYFKGQPMAVSLVDVHHVLHIEGAGGEPDGHWDRYKDGKGKFPST